MDGFPVWGTAGKLSIRRPSKHWRSPGTQRLEGESELISTFMLEELALAKQPPLLFQALLWCLIRFGHGTYELSIRKLAN